MPDFKLRPGTKRSSRRLKQPIADITAFDAIVHSLLSRDRIILSSYSNDQIQERVEAWVDSVPELAG